MNKVIAFVGNPNVGKSAWINRLSHADFTVGNWPGVTIEKKQARIKVGEEVYELIDLPGVYSLNQSSNEELITQRYLQEKRVDCIVNVVDVLNLKRNLLLTMKLRELNLPMLILLNFKDEANKRQVVVDEKRIANFLGAPLYYSSAYEKDCERGFFEKLKEAMQFSSCYHPILYGEDERQFVRLYNETKIHMPKLDQRHRMNLVYDLIDERSDAIQQCKKAGLDERLLSSFAQRLNQDRLMQGYMKVIHQQGEQWVRFPQVNRWSMKLDHYLLHRFYAYPILCLIFILMLLSVFRIANPFGEFIELFFRDFLNPWVASVLDFLPQAALDFLCDGILLAIGGVLQFLPLMYALFFVLGVLEESGYMARIVCLMDRLMRYFHLSGRAFLSLLLGFGCNVPAIYATRTIEDERERLRCAFLVPFMSCSARLPIYLMFAQLFFPNHVGLAVLSVIGFGIVIALLMALLLKEAYPSLGQDVLVLEMVDYRLPKLSTLFQKAGREVKNFLHKVFTMVLFTMMIMWSLCYFPNGEMSSSYLMKAADKVAFIFEPAGFGINEKVVASIPSGITAKESVVAFLSSFEEHEMVDFRLNQALVQQADNFKKALKKVFGWQEKEAEPAVKNVFFTDSLAKLRAFCFMVYMCCSVPCVMTLVSLYKEYGWKLMLASFVSMLVIPYLVSVAIFQLFRWFV